MVVSIILVYLFGGWTSHLLVFLFLMELVFAWLIHCRGLGLPFRIGFFLMSFVPLLAGICAAAGNSVSDARSIRESIRSNSIGCGLVYHPLEHLSTITIGAAVTLMLLALSALLFLSKNAEPLRRGIHAAPRAD